MIRSEHLQLAAMLLPTLVLFIAMVFIIVVPEGQATASTAAHESAEIAVMETEMWPLGTVFVR